MPLAKMSLNGTHIYLFHMEEFSYSQADWQVMSYAPSSA